MIETFDALVARAKHDLTIAEGTQSVLTREERLASARETIERLTAVVADLKERDARILRKSRQISLTTHTGRGAAR